MADQSEFEFSRHREGDIQEFPLGPDSLVGSWWHRLENNEIVEQGSVVAEPQPGIYLLEVHDWTTGLSAHQRLIRVEQMVKTEDEEWRFFDNPAWMRLATDAHEGVNSPKRSAMPSSDVPGVKETKHEGKKQST